MRKIENGIYGDGVDGAPSDDCFNGKPFIPPTTDSRHALPIVPNLTRKLVPTGLDRIWVADITYVRLMEDFVYLAIVLEQSSERAPSTPSA
jgi:putative transposase